MVTLYPSVTNHSEREHQESKPLVHADRGGARGGKDHGVVRAPEQTKPSLRDLGTIQDMVAGLRSDC